MVAIISFLAFLTGGMNAEIRNGVAVDFAEKITTISRSSHLCMDGFLNCIYFFDCILFLYINNKCNQRPIL